MRDYNFFSAYDKKKELKISPSSPYFIAGIILLVAVLATAGLVVRNVLLEGQIQDVRDEITALQSSQEYADAMGLQAAMDALTQYERSADVVLADFERSDMLGTELLDQLAATVPATAVVTSMSLTNANFAATYTVPDKKAAAELILQMENSGLFNKVHAPNISQSEGQAGYIVSVQCSMKGVEAE